MVQLIHLFVIHVKHSFKCHTLKHLNSLQHVSIISWSSSGSFLILVKFTGYNLSLLVLLCGSIGSFVLHLVLSAEACHTKTSLMMISWWSKHVGVILSALMCDIELMFYYKTSVLFGPLYIVNWNARRNSEICWNINLNVGTTARKVFPTRRNTFGWLLQA
jgi:hypothetical protein